jgi:hypothetical protein
VDGGGYVFEDFSYDPVEHILSITRDPFEDLDLKVSFEPYTLTLDSQDSVPLGGQFTLEMAGGDAFDPIVLFLAFQQKETKIGQSHLLVYPFSPTYWFQSVLDALGCLTLPFQIPNDPSLLDVTIYHQFVTHDKSLKALSNMEYTLFY